MNSVIQTTLRSARAIGQLALPLVLLLLLLGARAARAQSNLGIGTAAPDASALVENAGH